MTLRTAAERVYLILLFGCAVIMGLGFSLSPLFVKLDLERQGALIVLILMHVFGVFWLAVALGIARWERRWGRLLSLTALALVVLWLALLAGYSTLQVTYKPPLAIAVLWGLLALCVLSRKQMEPARRPMTPMRFVRLTAMTIFCVGAVLMLVFSVCVSAMMVFGFVALATGRKPPVPAEELYVMPLYALAVFVSSLYILAGRRRWQANIAISALGVLLLFSLTHLALIWTGIPTPWSDDDINMGYSLGGYGLFMLAGVILKALRFWDDEVAGVPEQAEVAPQPEVPEI
ncbi:MAG: hypothetical protein ACR2IE_11430 [Candidatus Sumerlaeaceae bacterium]